MYYLHNRSKIYSFYIVRRLDKIAKFTVMARTRLGFKFKCISLRAVILEKISHHTAMISNWATS